MKLGTDVACHYCGAVATTVDHVRPRCSVPKGIKLPTVPACVDCNCRILGDKPLYSDEERGRLVASVLGGRVLRMGPPKWTEEDATSELTGNLRRHVLRHLRVYAVTKARAEWATTRWSP